MDFEFTPEQRQMQESVRTLLADRYDTARLRQIADEQAFDTAVWDALAEAGVFSVPVSEAHGGLGLGPIDTVLLLEEFGRVLVPAPVTETLLAAELIGRYGTPAQQEQFLPGITEGSLRVTLAVAEPDGAAGVAGLTSQAAPRAGGWVLDGSKILVPNVEACGLILIAARFGDVAGIALCQPNATGLTVRLQAVLDHTSRYHALTFAGVALSTDAVLGGQPRPEAAARLFNLGAAAAAAEMTGIAARLLDDSVAYAGQRVQFGKPIGSFQAIKHRCADIATAVEGARSAAYHAALALTEGALTEDGSAAAKSSSIAKAFAGEAARKACNDAIQIHGGIGFTWELGLHLWLRRCRTLESQYGDTAWHRDRVVALTLAELGLAA